MHVMYVCNVCLYVMYVHVCMYVMNVIYEMYICEIYNVCIYVCNACIYVMYVWNVGMECMYIMCECNVCNVMYVWNVCT
jgi:hypothetical protein